MKRSVSWMPYVQSGSNRKESESEREREPDWNNYKEQNGAPEYKYWQNNAILHDEEFTSISHLLLWDKEAYGYVESIYICLKQAYPTLN
jgi:hypothetical protein